MSIQCGLTAGMQFLLAQGKSCARGPSADGVEDSAYDIGLQPSFKCSNMGGGSWPSLAYKQDALLPASSADTSLPATFCDSYALDNNNLAYAACSLPGNGMLHIPNHDRRAPRGLCRSRCAGSGYICLLCCACSPSKNRWITARNSRQSFTR
jgi:hypothetical protein